MAKSLQDQLLGLGLVDENRIKKAKNDKYKQNTQKDKNKPGAVDEHKLQAQKAQAEKAERDRQLNLQRKEDAERQAVAAQIKQLIETHRQPKGDGDVPYNFIDNSKVKRIFVSEAMREQIAHGKSAIVRLNKQYEIVPAEIAEKIRIRNEKSVVFYNDPQQSASKDDGEDPYADYKIPDDLIW